MRDARRAMCWLPAPISHHQSPAAAAAASIQREQRKPARRTRNRVASRRRARESQTDGDRERRAFLPFLSLSWRQSERAATAMTDNNGFLALARKAAQCRPSFGAAVETLGAGELGCCRCCCWNRRESLAGRLLVCRSVVCWLLHKHSPAQTKPSCSELTLGVERVNVTRIHHASNCSRDFLAFRGPRETRVLFQCNLAPPIC